MNIHKARNLATGYLSAVTYALRQDILDAYDTLRDADDPLSNDLAEQLAPYIAAERELHPMAPTSISAYAYEQALLATQARVEGQIGGLEQARASRSRAIRAAHEAGWTKYRIAKALGLSQTAIAKELAD